MFPSHDLRLFEYEVETKLVCGHYVARNKRFAVKQKCLVKCVHIESCTDDDIQRLQEEFKISQLYHHVNALLSIEQMFLVKSHLYAIYPFMPFGSLYDLVLLNSHLVITSKVCASVAYQVISALCYLHSKGIVHGSVQSSRIFLDPSGQVLLLSPKYIFSLPHPDHLLFDFPLDRESERNLYWKSPEILAQDFQGFNTSSDMYSLGLVLTHLLTKQLPFSDLEPAHMLLEKCLGRMPSSLKFICTKTHSFVTSPSKTKDLVDPDQNKKMSRLSDFGACKSTSSIHFFSRKSSLIHRNNALNFICSCLQSNFQLRPSAYQSLSHAFFKKIHNIDMSKKFLKNFLMRANEVDDEKRDNDVFAGNSALCDDGNIAAASKHHPSLLHHVKGKNHDEMKHEKDLKETSWSDDEICAKYFCNHNGMKDASSYEWKF